MSPFVASPRDSVSEHQVDELSFLWLEITPKCNLKCIHCYVSATPHLPLYGDMECEDWQGVMEDAYDYGCRRLQFIGGEPTLHPDLPELIRFARDVGYEFVEVFSNGTVLTDELKKTYLENKVALAFSVYAPEAETHEKVTQRAGSFSKTIRTIRWALGNELEVRAGVIDMPANAEVVDETCDFLRELGVDSVKEDRARGIGRGETQAASADQYEELCGQCWKGKLCVTAYREVFPCVMARGFQVGDYCDSLTTVLHGAPLRTFRSQFRRRQGDTAHAHSHEKTGSCRPGRCIPLDPCTPDRRDDDDDDADG